jgi:hypothetical protein
MVWSKNRRSSCSLIVERRVAAIQQSLPAVVVEDGADPLSVEGRSAVL